MTARVFISCGQRHGERKIAQEIADQLRKDGFRPYIALEAQSIQDVNSGIIGELRRSDYYVFIDFRRESLCNEDGPNDHRGSLFSHQELAIAYALNFEKAIFFREAGVRLEGIGKFMMSNATEFDDRSKLAELVAKATARMWNAQYSRNLVVGQLHFPPNPIQTPSLLGRFLSVDILNRRPDEASAGALARLAGLQVNEGEAKPSPNKSPLKVTGQAQAFQQTILPKDHGAFDLLCVDYEPGSKIFLHNALDVPHPPAIIEEVGLHHLDYEVFAPGFERLRFTVALQTTGECASATATLVLDHDREA